MLRRWFIPLVAQWSSLDLWRLQVQQMKRDESRKELDARDRAATRLREIREALLALDKTIHADYLKVVDPNTTDAPAVKRLRDAARRFYKALE